MKSTFARPALLSASVVFLLPLISHAQEKRAEYHQRISAILQRAAAEVRDGEEADSARVRLARAFAKNGDFTEAKTAIRALKSSSQRAGAWKYLGRAQGKFFRDKAGAAESFAASLADAKQIDSGEYDRSFAIRSLATAQAESDDIAGALRLVDAVGTLYKTDLLTDVARVAARDGEFAPAESLLKYARGEENISETNALICIGHAGAYNWAPAEAALARVTRPQDKVLALLAMFDNQKLADGEADKFLPQAIALVPQIRSDAAADFSGIIRDALWGAIALKQLDNPDEKIRISSAVQTLARIEDAENAQKPIVKICRILAARDLAQARAIVSREGMNPAVRIAGHCAITRRLGQRWAFSDDNEKPAVHKEIETSVNQAVQIMETMEASDRNWAFASIAASLAHARDYKTAFELAQKVEGTNRRAYALSGITFAAIDQRNTARITEGFDAIVANVKNEADPNTRAMLLAQSIQDILDPLLEDEPVGVAEAMAGLN